METFQFQAIGYGENEFRETTKPDTLTASLSRIVLAADLVEGLSGLEPGMTLLVIFVFHRAYGSELLQHPRGDGVARNGVFLHCAVLTAPTQSESLRSSCWSLKGMC